MSNRGSNDASRADDDDNLDYLDAGLSSNDVDGRGDTGPIGPKLGSDVSSLPFSPGTNPGAEPGPVPVNDATSQASVVTFRERDTSWTWPLINLAGLVAVVAVNYAANYFEFNGLSTGDVVNRNPAPFQPAGWVFSIWGVIYLLLAGFVVYGLLPAGRNSTRLRRISPLFLVSNIANVTWIVLWHWEQFAASLGAMLALLVSLVAIYIGVRVHNPFRRSRSEPAPRPGRWERLALRTPFSVYLGWILVASLANVMVWSDRSGQELGVFSQNWWAIVMMAIATLVAAVFMATARDGLIAAVMAVAFVGIAQHNWGDSTMVSVAAIVFTVLAAGIAGMAFVLAYDRDTNRSPFGGSPEQGKPMA